MIRKFSKRFVNYIASPGSTTDEIEAMEYILNTYLFEFLKMAVIILIFSLAGYFKECLTVLIVFATIRPYIGGYHEPTQLRCFSASLIFTAAIITLSLNVQINLTAQLILLLISGFAVYNQAPVLNPEMPITHEENIKRNRDKGIIHFGIWMIAALILYKYMYLYSAIILWSLVFNAVLMFNRKS